MDIRILGSQVGDFSDVHDKDDDDVDSDGGNDDDDDDDSDVCGRSATSPGAGAWIINTGSPQSGGRAPKIPAHSYAFELFVFFLPFLAALIWRSHEKDKKIMRSLLIRV